MDKRNSNLYVYMSGFAGNLGTKVLIEKKISELSNHFSKEYLSNLKEVIEGGMIPSSICINYIDKECIGKGGVLASLWSICDRNKYGLNFFLKEIPIYQGTIEISNFFDINPYRLLTTNAELYITDKKYDENKYGFKCIGEITSSKKRVRVDCDAESFLIKCFKDEIDKVK